MEPPAVGPNSDVPATTKMLAGLGGLGMSPPNVAVAHSGAGTGLPDNALRGATKPPPKFSTFVNVCVSPPRFSNARTVPSSTVPAAGSKCHAPAFLAEVTSLINCENVIVPSPTQVPAPTAALNVVGSHLSLNRTTIGSLAAVKTTEAAMETITSVAAKHSLTLFMFLPFLRKSPEGLIRREWRRPSKR